MKYLASFLIMAFSLFGNTKAVIFDFGNVVASPDPQIMVQFLQSTFHLNEEEFNQARWERKAAGKKGEEEGIWWFNFGKKKGLSLPDNWPEIFDGKMKESLGANLAMYALIDELKAKNIQVGMLSNIDESLAKRIRKHGLYNPFSPCLLSYEMGVLKPDEAAYQMLLDALPYSPDEIVFIDDLPENVEAARKLGIDAILFKSPEQARSDISRRDLL